MLVTRTRLLHLALPFALLSTPAFAADEKAACVEAASNAQSLRDAHKLVEARTQLLVCAAAGCPSVVQTDCVKWLAQVEAGLPSVVITAKDDTGRALFDVKVAVDGQPLASKLQGEALAVNPGVHTLHLQSADGLSVDQQVLVKEGMKNQDITVTLGKGGKPGAPPLVVSPGATPAPSAAVSTTPAAAPSGGGSPLRTAGWISGGVGIAGLAVGTIFGIVAISDKSAANCRGNSDCNASDVSSAKSAATVSTVGIIVGSVLLAGGAGLVLFAPKGDASPAASSLRLMPLVGARDAGMMLGGAW
jgi:hypothetical protein